VVRAAFTRSGSRNNWQGEGGRSPLCTSTDSDKQLKGRRLVRGYGQSTPLKAFACSDCLARSGSRHVLIVGAERSDEFVDAIRLVLWGHRVTVVNPRDTAAAGSFEREGGSLFRSTIERLPAELGPFDVICENYPYTVARVAGVCHEKPCPIWLSRREMRAYAMARLKRLAPNGRWIVFTESPGFTCVLRSIGRGDETIRRCFDVRVVRLTKQQAPPSSYPQLATRFRLIFQRRPVKGNRAMDWRKRRTQL